MTQMLMLVHGMGAHPAAWSDDPGGPKPKLNEVSCPPVARERIRTKGIESVWKAVGSSNATA